MFLGTALAGQSRGFFEGHRWSLLLSAPREEQGEIIPEMADAWKFATEPFMIG
jgi:hypothetical protein